MQRHPGGFQAGAEVSRLEGLESLHVTGWSGGSTGEEWAGPGATHQHPEPPAGWRDREISLGSEGTVCLVLNKVLKVTEEERVWEPALPGARGVRKAGQEWNLLPHRA